MNKSTLLIASLVLSAFAAHATESAPAAQAEAPAAAASTAVATAASPKQICRKERPIGSNIAVTVCHPAEPDPDDAAAVEALRRDIQRQSAISDQNRHH